MSALRDELVGYLNAIPDDKLVVLKPLLHMLSNELYDIERVHFSDLSSEERKAIEQAEHEYEIGETVSHEDIDWN